MSTSAKTLIAAPVIYNELKEREEESYCRCLVF